MKRFSKSARMEDVEQALMEDGSVYVRGFGKFYLGTVKEREWKHPTTGETMTMPETKTVRFKVSKTIKGRLKG